LIAAIALLAPVPCGAVEFGASRAKVEATGRVLEIVTRLHAASARYASGSEGVVGSEQRAAAEREVNELLAARMTARELSMLARLSWTVSWPSRAEEVPADVVFETAYYECIRRLSTMPGSDAGDALIEIARFSHAEAGEREILERALERQRQLTAPLGSNDPRFSAQEIAADVREFSAVVLEASANATLRDYAKFQGVHRENEYELELAHCITQLGSPPSCGRQEPELSDSCKDWWNARSATGTAATSRFYERLRERASISTGTLRILSQESSTRQGTPIVIVHAEGTALGKPVKLDFWHWPERASADSLVGLLRYEGRDIEAEISSEALRETCPSATQSDALPR
jgi:hypothetical protein